MTVWDLSVNQIPDLPPPLFQNLQNLKQLSMEEVEIPNISIRMFRSLSNLSHIPLSLQLPDYARHNSCRIDEFTCGGKEEKKAENNSKKRSRVFRETSK
ncbi:hypothetical protein NFI96_010243 [Prochilodus magdalenae]|nr:hypothetical protein NFI96_010243 [Prochilodus magdalenae]